MNSPIDLRSDTVTTPTPAMRQAMADAVVGDDVYGEDPTVNRLEMLVAQRLGKEAALFVSSGTMGNLVSVLSHCGRGDELILGDQAHIFHYEQGGSSAVGGVHPHILPNQPDGTIDLDRIAKAIRSDNEHYPATRLIALENTHNRCGGSVLSPDYVDAVGQLAHTHNLALHVSVCFSKGLAAPVGSAVAGSQPFIRRARRMRKQLGGGTRQAGVLAAAALVALEEMVDRLTEDHRHARQLADGLAALDGIELDPTRIQTNIVYFKVTQPGWDAARLSQALATTEIRINPTGPNQLRAVTHYQIDAEQVDWTVATVKKLLASK
jgi:threonine aldolase